MIRHLIHRATTVVVLALALLAGACGDDGGTTSADDTAADTATSDALAEAIRIDAAVDARIADAADYAGINNPTPVAAGDNIRTDTTGFAEIAYFDGSLTRLDINTDFTVVELTDSPGDSAIRTQMGIGRTWHRVQTLTGNDTYQVETSVATAVVRGTAFIIECTTTACTFTVLESTIELTTTNGETITLDTNETITIQTNGEPLEPTTITDPFTDPWLTRNTELDTQQNFNPLNTDTDTDTDTDESGATADLTVDVMPDEIDLATLAVAQCAGQTPVGPFEISVTNQSDEAGRFDLVIRSAEGGPEFFREDGIDLAPGELTNRTIEFALLSFGDITVVALEAGAEDLLGEATIREVEGPPGDDPLLGC